MTETYSVHDYRNAARRAMEAGNVAAAEELAQAGIALQRQLGERPAPPRDNPHPDIASPQPMEDRAQMAANMLPPGTDARTIPQAQPGILPDSMPAIGTTRQLPDRAEAIFEAENGGVVYRQQGGELGFVGPNFASTDRETIMQIMRGQHPGTAERAVNEAMIDAHPIAARGAAAFQGVPAIGSYLDEAVGAMLGPRAGAAVTQIQGAMEEARPGQTGALRAAGTVAGAAPMIAAAPPSQAAATLTRGGLMLRNAAIGGVAGGAEGAVYGAGEQEGGRVSNAVTQGAIGAGLGIAGGMAVGAIDRALLGRASRLRGQSVQAIQDELGVSPAAAQLIREALDGGEMERAAQTLERRGPSAMLAEASPALRQLLNTQTKTSIAAGAAANRAIEVEGVRRYGVLTDVLDSTMGRPQGREFVAEGVMDASRPARSAAYDDAYASPINYASESGQRLESILRNRLPRGLIERANNAMREAGEQSPQIMAQIADDGSVTFSRPLSVPQIDYITRELQNMEGAAIRAEGRAADAQRWGGLRRDIRSILRADDQVPAYGRALDAGSDAIAQREALDLGARALTMRRGELLFELRGASDAERGMVAQGLREQVDDMMARAGQLASDRAVESREVRRVMQPLTGRQGRENLIAILGPDDGRQVFEAVEQAVDGLELRAAIARNSDSAIALATQSRASELTADGLFDALGQGSIGDTRRSIVHALSGSSSEAQQLRMNNLAQEVVTILTSQTGESAQRALRIISEYVDNPAAIPVQDAEIVARVLTRAGVLSAYQQSRLALTPQ